MLNYNCSTPIACVSLSDCKHLQRRQLIENTEFNIDTSLTTNTHSTRWAQFFPQGDNLEAARLLAIEAGCPDNVILHYIWIKIADQVVGAAYCQIVSIQTRYLLSLNPSAKKIRWLSRLKKSVRLLVCGNIFAGTTAGYQFLPHLPFEKKQHALQILQHAFITLGKKYRVDGLCIIGLEKHHVNQLTDTHSLKKYAARYQIPLPDDIKMQLSIAPEWKNIDSYIQALTRKYAARTRKVYQQIQPITISEFTRAEILQYNAKLTQLFHQTAARAAFVIANLNNAYFQRLAAELGDRFAIRGYWRDNNLIGFSSHIFADHAHEIHYVGIDYTDPAAQTIYHHILLSGIEIAIARRASVLKLGRTALEAKAIVGAKPVVLGTKLWIWNYWLRQLVNYFLVKSNLQTPAQTWQQRNPFKSATNLADTD